METIENECVTEQKAYNSKRKINVGTVVRFAYDNFLKYGTVVFVEDTIILIRTDVNCGFVLKFIRDVEVV